MIKSSFSFKNYKSLLLWRIETSTRGGRGIRAKLAEAIQIQGAYLSRVLNGDADLNLEQAEGVTRFFNFTHEESRYFLLLVERGRAGTSHLKAHFDREIQALLDSRERVTMERDASAKKILSLEDQLMYYSSWIYSAIHIALSIPDLQTIPALANELKLPADLIAKTLDFLIRTGMATEQGGRYEIGKVWIHLPPESALAAKCHSLWRMKAVSSAEKMERENFHYTQVVSISASDAKRIIDILSQVVDQSNDIIRPSKEEELRCLAIDFFSIS